MTSVLLWLALQAFIFPNHQVKNLVVDAHCQLYITSVRDSLTNMYKFIGIKDIKAVSKDGSVLFKILPTKSYKEFYINFLPTNAICFEKEVNITFHFSNGKKLTSKILNRFLCNKTITFPMCGIFGKENIFADILNHDIQVIELSDSVNNFELKLKDVVSSDIRKTFECLVSFEND